MLTITYEEIFDRIYKSEDFAKVGINEWCLNEGLADKLDTIDLTDEQCLVFMSKFELDARHK